MSPRTGARMRLLAGVAGMAALAVMAGCERPPVESLQGGFRGTGMDTMINPRADAVRATRNVVPDALPAAAGEGPPATAVYKNVQVLTDLNIGQFTRVMLAMSQWVAPADQSCNYCHAGDMSSDEKYTKVVARRMLQMVRHLNSDWKAHVGATGVTCYTCHRGNVVPQYVWFGSSSESHQAGLSPANGNLFSPAATIGTTSLPYDPYTQYLAGDASIRVIAAAALPGSGPNNSLQHTEATYALMTHISTSLGVNCTYCHNTRSFAAWDAGTPKRTTAWYGIRMVRDVNNGYLKPLTRDFPAHRLGAQGDVAKVNCMTCHQGVFKPLYGEGMLKDYPELAGAHPPQPAAPPTASLGAGVPGAALP